MTMWIEQQGKQGTTRVKRLKNRLGSFERSRRDSDGYAGVRPRLLQLLEQEAKAEVTSVLRDRRNRNAGLGSAGSDLDYDLIDVRREDLCPITYQPKPKGGGWLRTARDAGRSARDAGIRLLYSGDGRLMAACAY